MLLIMGVTLYTSRVVLRVLGVEDFGIYNVVGGVVSIMSFFISSLSNVTQRYMNIGLGKQDLMETGCAFRQSLTLMWLLSVLLLLFGETLGLWFVYNKLVIPPERLGAAVWVYHFSLISILSAINQVPLMGAIVAHERMNIYAYLGLFEACARLFIVYLLEAFGTIDSLILYGLLMAIVSVFVWLIYAIYSVRSFTECKFRFYWNYSLVAEMSKFIGQNLFGCFAWSAGVQGTNILLNIFFGVAVNAARGITTQVDNALNQFVSNFVMALNPQITKSYASGNREYMMKLVMTGSRYSFYLLLIMVIPILFETEYILACWLKNTPKYTVIFVQLSLIYMLCQSLSNTLFTAMLATGNIRNYQIIVGGLALMAFPLSYGLFKMGFEPAYCYYATIFISILCLVVRLIMLHRIIGLSIRIFFKDVIVRVILVSIFSLISPYIIISFMTQGLERFIILSLVSLVATCIFIFFSGISKDERTFFITYIKNKFNKRYERKF